MDRETILRFEQELGLTYHVSYALEAQKTVPFKDQRILEVGGCLPSELVIDYFGAAQWIGIEELSYWDEQPNQPDVHFGSPPDRSKLLGPLSEASAPDTLPTHGCLSGRVDDSPAAFNGAFDAIFSIAAFEHILNFPVALDAMFRCLRPGGKLFTMYSPIWSALDGHHLPRLVDKSGQVIDFHTPFIPPWGHLLMRPPQMYDHLLKHTDPETAGEIVYFIYHSPHINRLFTEDYVAFIKASPFEIEQLGVTFPNNVSEDLQAELQRLHPGRVNFANNGIILTLVRPG